MRLLVSVRDRLEANAALAGGADIIDAKEPAAGPLGAVSMAVLREIRAAVSAASLVTAALGDATDERTLEDLARAYADAGAGLIKIGFAGTRDVARATSLLCAAIRGAHAGSDRQCGVVAVAYADAHTVPSLDRDAVTEAAVKAGAAGVLLDTADKQAPGLRELISPAVLTTWVTRAHRAGLLVAVAGRLKREDLDFVRDAGANIAGVRGAACEGGRTGRVTREQVESLVACLTPIPQ